MFFTIVGMKFWLFGETYTTMFPAPEEGDMGYPQNSNKYNNTDSHKHEDSNAILFSIDV